MKKSFFGFLIGFISGLVSAYFIYKYKKEIMERLTYLEKKIKSLELSKSISSTASEVVSSLKRITEEVESVTDWEKEILLNKVEAKIRKLEEIIK